LHDNTSYNIFERFSQFGQLIQALFNNIRRPLVDFVLLVCVATNSAFDAFFDYVAYFIYNECGLVLNEKSICYFHHQIKKQQQQILNLTSSAVSSIS
jgi:hypothetical protein